MADDERLYHLALRDEWDCGDARVASHYRRSTHRPLARTRSGSSTVRSRTKSSPSPTWRTRGRDDVVLLVIDRSQLDSEVRVEALTGDQEFPHIYGPLPIAAVVDVRPVPKGSDGSLDAAAVLFDA